VIIIAKPITSLNNISQLVFVIDTDCVCSDVGTELLYRDYVNISLPRATMYTESFMYTKRLAYLPMCVIATNLIRRII
jgi:hypothetical protein